MSRGPEQQKLAVGSGVWPLFRFDPRRVAAGQPPLRLDSGAPRVPVQDYMKNEARFPTLGGRDSERFGRLLRAAQLDAARRFSVYQQLAAVTLPRSDDGDREEWVS